MGESILLDQHLICLIIPIYQPGPQFLELLRQLRQQLPGCPLIIVDDGSGPDYQDYFATCQSTSGNFYFQHAHNRGKGQALKTAFSFVLSQFPQALGVITIDGDGQHQLSDIQKILDNMRAHPQAMVLGARQFSGNVPWRSKLGNQITGFLFALLTKKKLQDTQTGLRGIPLSLLPAIIQSPAEHYALEMQMLFLVIQQQIKMREVPIATLYFAGNRNSHFRPFLDAVRIYRTFFAHFSPVLTPLLLDCFLFWQFAQCKSLATAFWGAKILSLLFAWAIAPSELPRLRRTLISGFFTFGLLLLHQLILWFPPVCIKMGGELLFTWMLKKTQDKTQEET